MSNLDSQNIESMMYKISNLFNLVDTNILLSFLFIIGTFALVFGSIKEGNMDPSTIILCILVAMGVYFYIKKQYSKELKTCRLKNKVNTGINLLEDLCETPETKNKELCNKFNEAKSNYANITNVLLQQYKTTLKY